MAAPGNTSETVEAPRLASLSGAVGAGRRAPAKERAYAYLRDGILTGGIGVGARLGADALAQTLGMSRTPVREALQLLVQEGLVEPADRRQVMVRRFSQHARHEIFLMRHALETAVVREACSSITDEALDELRLLLFQLERARDGDLAKFIDLDERFHVTLADRAGLPMFREALVRLRAFLRLMGLDALRRPGRTEQVLSEHRAVLEALEARDPEVAASAMARHLRTTKQVLDEAEGEAT